MFSEAEPIIGRTDVGTHSTTDQAIETGHYFSWSVPGYIPGWENWTPGHGKFYYRFYGQ